MSALGSVNRGLLVVVLFLAIAFSAQAYSVDRVWLDFHGNEVSTIAPGIPLPDTVLKLALSSDFGACLNGTAKSCSIRVSADALSQDSSVKQQLHDFALDVRRNCANVNGTLTCTSFPFAFSTTSATMNVNYVLTADSSTSQSSSTISVSLDSTIPTVASITTGYCDAQSCYVSNALTPVHITFTDATTSFNYKMVYLGIDGKDNSLASITSCNGNTCDGVLATPCSDGDQFTLQLRKNMQTREDSQNPVTLGSGQHVVCSQSKPTLLDWSSLADGIAGQAVGGGSITYAAHLQGLGTITGVANDVNGVLANASQASCTDDGGTPDTWTCTWTFSSLISGKYSMDFVFSDAIGNTVEKIEKLTVLNLSSKPVVGGVSVAVGQVNPDAINRMALELARTNYMPYPAYLTYSVVRNNPNLNVLDQELKGCWYKLPNTLNYSTDYGLFSFGGQPVESRVLYPNAGADVQNRLNLQIRADPRILASSDRFDAKCELDFTLSQGNIIYSAPQQVNISFSVFFRDSPLGQPGAAFVTKIKEQQDNLNSGTAKTVRGLENLRQKLDIACKGIDTIMAVKSVATLLTAVSNAQCSAPPTYAHGKIGDTKAEQMQKKTNNVITSLWDGKLGFKDNPFGAIGSKIAPNNALVGQGGPLKLLCRQVNCRVFPDVKGAFADSTGSKTASNSNALSLPTFPGLQGYLLKDVTSNANVADPQASLVGAASTMCFGGVVYNLQKYQTIDCGYLKCLEDQSLQGSSVSVCELGRSTRLCTQVMGEVSELPYARIFTNIAGNINSVIQNLPSVLAKYALDKRCKLYDSLPSDVCPNWVRVGCRVQQSVFGIADSQKQTTQAFQGIRDPNAAQNLKMCNDLLPKTGTTTVPAPAGFSQFTGLFGAVGRVGAISRDIDARAITNPSSSPELSQVPKFIQEADKAWQDSYKGRALPSSYAVEYKADGTVVATATVDAAFVPTTQVPTTPSAVSSPTATTPSEYPFDDRPRIFEPPSTGILGTTPPTLSPTPPALPGGLDTQKIQLSVTFKPEGVSVNDLKTAYTSDVVTASRDGIIFVPNLKNAQGDPITIQDQASIYVGTKTLESVQKPAEIETELSLINDEFHAAKAPDKSVLDKNHISDCGASTCTITVKCSSGTNCVGGVQKVVIPANAYLLQRDNAARVQAQAIGAVTDYVAKWAYDAGYLNFLKLSGWTSVIPGIGEITKFANTFISPTGFNQNLCNAKYDIQDNDQGVVFDTSTSNLNISATFGTEIFAVANESGKQFGYVTVVYVNNPSRTSSLIKSGKYDYLMSISFTGLQSCIASPCPSEYSLTNTGQFNLSEGVNFGNGNGPKTRIVYLPGEYSKICIRFDHNFPDPVYGKTEYCRTIKEEVFDNGDSVLPTSTNGVSNTLNGVTAPSSIDATQGWT